MVHRRANQPKKATKRPGVCKLAPKCKKTEATRWRPVPGGGECCGGNACMISLGLKKEKAEYAAARSMREAEQLAAAQGEAAEADDSSSSSSSRPASPQPEEETDGPPVADPPAPMPEAPPAEEPAPAAVDEQAAEPASSSQQLRLIDTGETRREVYDEGYENGRQAGRDRADLDRLLVIKMLQHQLVRCTEHLEQANRWLKISHMGCVDYGIHGEFEGSDHDEHIKTLCSENAVLAELWHTIATERCEDLAIRDRAYRAQHGR